MKTLTLTTRKSLTAFYCSVISLSKPQQKLSISLVVPFLLIGSLILLNEYFVRNSYFSWSILTVTFPFGFIFVPFLYVLHSNNEKINKRNYSYIISLVLISLFFLTYLYIIVNDNYRYKYNLDYAILVHFFSFLYLAGYVLFLKTEAIISKDNWKLLRFGLYLTFIALFCIQLVQMHLLIQQTSIDTALNTSFITHNSMLSLGLITIYLNTNSRIIPKNFTSEPLAIDSSEEDFSRLMPSEDQLIYTKNIEHFIQSLGYLQHDISKEQFSNDLAIPESFVLPMLKKEYGLGFNAFINHLRLTYAVELLQNNNETINIEELAGKCGFKSRATFYRNFKNTYNCTPHQYRNKMNKINSQKK